MAPPLIEAKRRQWRGRYSPRLPLREQLDSPYVPAWQLAHVMGLSESTVYTSGKRFDAAMRAGDREAAAREVPCILIGSTHRFPTVAVVSWWESGGGATLEALVGHEMAKAGVG